MCVPWLDENVIAYQEYISHIFNCDEIGMPLNPKVENKVGTKTPCNVTGNPKCQIMVLACSSAAGYLLLHFVNFDRKKKELVKREGEVQDARCSLCVDY